MSIFRGLTPRHIQDHNASSAVTHHWGYADRQVPCVNDKGSCEYLDAVYDAHDVGMMYMGILWASILGILLIWATHTFCSRGVRPGNRDFESSAISLSTTDRWRKAVSSWRRQFLLPDCCRPIFGRTTRVQVLTLAVITGYLTIFTFAGITYNHWITPVKNNPNVHNTRSSLGPWSDRIGVIAYALTPLSLLLSSRESLLSLITGLPYQSFNFLHRWLGYLIVVQSILHTIGWCIIEIRLYQPQPKVAIEWIKQLYMIWGVIAMLFLFALFVLSTPWAIRKTGYEFFRKSHYILAMLYIGAAIGHWKQLQCFLVPALVVWFVDRFVRVVRTWLLHYRIINGKAMAFRSTEASLHSFPDAVDGDVVRLDLSQQQEPWSIGQHFYLCFPNFTIWQSHPFTPLNAPVLKSGTVRHSYIFRSRKGQTKKIAELASTSQSTSVILNGPYGVNETEDLAPSTNILCVAGGTGIAYVLPVLLSQIENCNCSSSRKMQLVWAIRCQSDMEWVRPELGRLYKAAKAMDLKISIYVTREKSDRTMESPSKGPYDMVTEKLNSESSSCSSSGKEITPSGCCGSKVAEEDSMCSPQPPRRTSITVERRGSLGIVSAQARHPDLTASVTTFIKETIQGSTTVYASGPGGMISDLRRIVADCNSGRKVLQGDLRSCVELKCDDRLEW